MLKTRGKKIGFIPKCSGLSSHKEQTHVLGVTMVPRLRRRQRPRRFSRPTADVLVLKAITSRSQEGTITNGTPGPFPQEWTTSTPEGLRDNDLQATRPRPLHQQRDNDLRLGRLDSSSNSLRETLLLKGPRSRPLTGDENQPLKLKSQRSGAQVAPTVSSAEATASAEVASPMATITSAPMTAATCPSTPHQRTAVAPKRTSRSSLPSSLRPSQNTSTALVAYDVLCDPPVQPTTQGGPGGSRPAHDATDTRVAGGQPRSAPAVGGGTRSSARAAQAGDPDTRRLTAPRAANTLLPQSLREGAGRRPREGGPRLGAPSFPARMMNILEVEGRGEATTRLALPRHEACGHHPG
jgi:hypothetical protein